VNSKTFAELLYRYWFYGWMFRDVNRGNVLERAAAARHNRERSSWLPTYLRRWTVLGVLSFVAGVAIEAVAVNAVTLATWVGLKVMPAH